MIQVTSPLVSVLMPVYNAGAYLESAIKSVIDQTFQDFEFVIVNDGSTDNSEQIIQSFKDLRIRLERNPQNMGLIYTLNRGLELCKGKYIVRMDSDDISLPTRIEKQIAWLEANPEYGLLGSWFEDFGDEIESRVIKYSSSNDEIRVRHLYQNHVAHPTAVIRSSVIYQNKLSFDSEYIHGEDYNFWVTIADYCKLSNYPEVLVRKRDHIRNISNMFASTMQSTCTKVKQRQFKKMGISISAAEAELYTRFCDVDTSLSESHMSEICLLLDRIYLANLKSEYLSPSYYGKYLAEKWFHLCYNNRCLKDRALFFWNSLSFNYKYNPKFHLMISLYFRRLGFHS